MRVCSSGDQKDGGEYLRVAGGEPRRLVVVVELGVAGIDAGDEPCGCRSTGVVETVAREHGEGHAMALRVPGVAVKLMATVVRPLDGRSLVGDELVRRRVRVSFVRWLQRSREREERMGRWPCSRRLRRSRRRGRRRAVAVATAEGISDGERRRRGRWRSFGANERSGLGLLEGVGDGRAVGHSGMARGRRWPRLLR